MVKTLCCLSLTLCAGTQAGGAEPAQPLTRLKALKQIPGVNDVHEFAPPFSKGATHQIQIWVGSSTTEILGSLGTTDFGGQINSVLLWVDEPLTTAVQKQALAASRDRSRLISDLGARCDSREFVNHVRACSWPVTPVLSQPTLCRAVEAYYGALLSACQTLFVANI